MIRTHILKTIPVFFQDIKSGQKDFELRKNDRKFGIMDRLILKEYDQEKDEFSGREIIKEVKYILDSFPGIETGYCILGLS